MFASPNNLGLAPQDEVEPALLELHRQQWLHLVELLLTHRPELNEHS